MIEFGGILELLSLSNYKCQAWLRIFLWPSGLMFKLHNISYYSHIEASMVYSILSDSTKLLPQAYELTQALSRIEGRGNVQFIDAWYNVLMDILWTSEKKLQILTLWCFDDVIMMQNTTMWHHNMFVMSQSCLVTNRVTKQLCDITNILWCHMVVFCIIICL